ncbi:hypothetical protein NY08_649 [Rhodococcus sp. B7740]|nr:hypothetical protein NY08_649 [Rhodococcus sp. B7740]
MGRRSDEFDSGGGRSVRREYSEQSTHGVCYLFSQLGTVQGSWSPRASSAGL